MNLNYADIVGCGAYAKVFRIERRVYKLFKSEAWEKGVPNAVRQKAFDSEMAAYEIAHKNESICRHTPVFYGTVAINSVTDLGGNDVSRRFLLDRCYSTEFIQGENQKVGALGVEYPHINEIIRVMHACGIQFTQDASVFAAEDHRNFKLIDFATVDASRDLTWDESEL